MLTEDCHDRRFYVVEGHQITRNWVLVCSDGWLEIVVEKSSHFVIDFEKRTRRSNALTPFVALKRPAKTSAIR